jgi:heme/copper-type cytochrome/quinol oxidase subunit 2
LATWSGLISIQLKKNRYKKKQNKEFSDILMLRKTNPLLAITLQIALFSTAGLPPFIGFLTKMNVFLACIESHMFLVSLITILLSIVSTFYYLRLVKIMCFEKALVGKLYKPMKLKQATVKICNNLLTNNIYIYIILKLKNKIKMKSPIEQFEIVPLLNLEIYESKIDITITNFVVQLLTAGLILFLGIVGSITITTNFTIKKKVTLKTFYRQFPKNMKHSLVFSAYEPASALLHSIVEFNQHHLLITLITLILVIIWWSFCHIMLNFIEFTSIQSRKFTHSKDLEIIWTSVPAITLLLLSIPSFTLLYVMDEAVAPDMTVKIIGHQWFWCYEIDDFLQIENCDIGTLKKALRYTSYLLVIDGVPSADSEGFFRLLETTKRIMLPLKTFLRLLITSADVLHSWSIPSFGIKMDACFRKIKSNQFIH